MLHRAASNAYSWWWASHIRTKQSKWMEQNLQDMEEKVQAVLKLLEEEGDSFAKRAEMYYKRRPELISFVEESFRAYRSLADRYDLVSKELQNANNTIASVCPDQVPYIDDDEDDGSPRPPRKMPEGFRANIPKVPKLPLKDLKSVITTATKKFNPRKVVPKKAAAPKAPSSGLSRKEALEEVDKLQKQILSLQTAKEFVKSSYDNAIARYWETEDQIKELQEKVSNLQDEFGEGVGIDDEEARRLMAEAALKSCQETLLHLQEKQVASQNETIIESTRVKEIKGKLMSLMDKFHYEQTDPKQPRAKRDVKEVAEAKDEDMIIQHRKELESLQNKIKQHFEAGSQSPLTVTEMAEKIDELVSKVISLETAVLSQTALVNRLKTETHDLNSLVQTLESDKESLIDDKVKLNDQLREMEEKLHEVQDLNHVVDDQNSNLQTHFTEARCNLDHLSEKVQNVKPDEEDVARDISETERISSSVAKDVSHKSNKKLQAADMVKADQMLDNTPKVTGSSKNEVTGKKKIPLKYRAIGKNVDFSNKEDSSSESSLKHKESDSNHISSVTETASKVGTQMQAMALGDDPDWQQLFMNGMDKKEKVLLTEYTNTLRNYREVKNKLAEVEKKTQDALFDSSLQLNELKTANALKDEEIRLLRQKLGILQQNLEGEEDIGELNSVKTPQNHVVEEVIKFEEPESTSAIEERFRTSIDELLEENLDFWLRFCTSFSEIQKFETTIKDLLIEENKIEEKWKSSEGSSSAKYNLKSDARPLYKHLAEIQNELTMWLENIVLLKEELQRRFASLCEIQDEIMAALKASAEDYDFKFTSYQAAKFQGEVLNMKQENNKVGDELQSGLDFVTTLQVDVEKALAKLNDKFALSTSKRIQERSSQTKNKVPLRSFIFGVKAKKQKQSIFSVMTPVMTPMHKKYRALKGHSHG